jgi:hypothetical protein
VTLELPGHRLRRSARLVTVTAVAACWLLVLTAQLPARQPVDPIRAAMMAIGANSVQSLHVTGFGAAFFYDENADATRVPLNRYEARADFAAASMQVVSEPVTPGAVPLTAIPAATPSSAPLSPWMTPHGFLQAAVRHGAVTREVPLGVEVSFTVGDRRYAGVIDDAYLVSRIRSWDANDVPGATRVEVTYRDYERHGRVRFPRHIVERRHDRPVLDVWVASVETTGQKEQRP